MNIIFQQLPRRRTSLLTGVAGAVLVSACFGETPAGLSDPTGSAAAAGQDAAAAASSGASAGNATSGGTEQGSGATKPMEEAGSGGVDAGAAPNGGAPTVEEGGAPGVVEEGGAAGATEAPIEGVHIGHACAFHTDAPPAAEGAAGSGGAAPTPDVAVQVSAFVGGYLTDAAGRTLYTYGADLPGDCDNLPVSNCTADCLVSWPVFDAGGRVLGPGLDDAAFGSIDRPEGGKQATYKGWPLYYYKSDLTLGQMTGQGKGKLWWVAETNLPAITIMKSGTSKYLADVDGRTLYVSEADQAGTSEAEPVSNCQGSCLQTFEGFHEKGLSVVTALELSDFEVFVRDGAGHLQIAYKGRPLYRAATDLKSGDMNGTAVAGFTAAIP
jgi:predicted lipoprotein with Yx(FWY)xxD motif